MANNGSPGPCQGFLGWIMGHKFKYSLGDYSYSSNYCSRCGMPKGGWLYDE